ncbi:MAG: hypothetical protein DHS20C15_23070 [Planctomycetota bacterium]|nr:MAG: hypothetical protein DHS20C15_23070 [Planctomycetota bacterium]
MGSRHPLDIFRSTDDGFDHASRRRRTVSGKVLGSNARSSSDEAKASRGAGLLGAKLKSKSSASKPKLGSTSAKRPPARVKAKNTRPTSQAKSKAAAPKALFSPAASAADSITRKLGYGAGVIVVIFLLVFVIRSTFVNDGGDASGFPTLKASEADELLGGAVAEDLTVSTVLAATYPPTQHGLTTAWNAHDELAARGFESIEVAQILGDDGAVKHYQLVVGRAAASTLGSVRDALQALNDWPAAPAAPFTGAQVIPHPLVASEG